MINHQFTFSIAINNDEFFINKRNSPKEYHIVVNLLTYVAKGFPAKSLILPECKMIK